MGLEVEAVFMRITFVLAIAFLGCTNKNPNLCCIDATDCQTIGLPDVTGCDEGLVCRGNQCIAQVCESANECDASAPYCIAPPDGRCQETCGDDSECPGFGQSAVQTFCEGGACVQCRADGNDCSGATPVCNGGTCVACTANDQCATGVCVDDGTCADSSTVAYVALTGSPTGDCTEAVPCTTIEAALLLSPSRPFVVIESGTYTRNATLALNGNRRLIGRGLTRPVLRRSTMGPIVTVSGVAVLSIERLEISGATGSLFEDDTGGHGVLCPPNGSPEMKLIDSVVRANVGHGFRGRVCRLNAVQTELSNNGGNGIALTDSVANIDRCSAIGNAIGIGLDAGVYSLTNTFVTRNTRRGLDVFIGSGGGSRIEFNTIVDNGTAATDAGFLCAAPNLSFPNNIISRNRVQTSASGCTFPNSIIIDIDITPLAFVSPDVAPFDYHIQAGSLAIDMATITTIDHDIDGDVRASDSADVGADEL